MNSDFRELLSLFEKHKVRYLVVGGYAVMLYAEPRYTKDLDLVIGTTSEDLAGFQAVMAEFGFPLTPAQQAEFAKPNHMIAIGRPPSRIDFLNQISGIDFEAAWERRNIVQLDGFPTSFISKEDLIAAKRAAGRPQDRLDLKNLQKKRK